MKVCAKIGWWREGPFNRWLTSIGNWESFLGNMFRLQAVKYIDTLILIQTEEKLFLL